MPDLSFFLDPPEPTVIGVLHVEALAPLSLVASQPGQFYRSQPAPTDAMLYGMLENALGWHFDRVTRAALVTGLRKQAKKALGRGHPLATSAWLSEAPEESGLGFASLLQWHLRFVPPRIVPRVTHYVDLWNQHLRRGDDFWGGSRQYDARLEGLVTRLRTKDETEQVKLASKTTADHTTIDSVEAGVAAGETVFQSALKPRFPHYYVSPTQREYVVPHGPYAFRAVCTPAVAELVAAALNRPVAPLYLGSSDGWVSARWESL